MLPLYTFMFPLYFATFSCLEAIAQNGSLPESFMDVNAEPQLIFCQNNLEVDQQGGHLQGVQILEKNNDVYAVISGSSGISAYYSVVQLGTPSRVSSVNVLMHKPFKHAGGIQIFQGFMVVGIEDNDLRDKSKVCIYKIDDPDNPPLKPLAVIERTGEPLRSTAGCCAMNRIKDKYLVIVGDWDTRHLDFYTCQENKLLQHPVAFERVYAMDTEQLDRSGWTDKAWHAYQNINLLCDHEGKLYLFGFGQNAYQQNIADLFLLDHKELNEFSLTKLVSKTFQCKAGADFRFGAGIFLQPGGKLKVVSCGQHIRESLVLNIHD